MKNLFRYHAATARVESHGGIAYVSLSGPMTTETLGRIKAAVKSSLPVPPSAYVVDWRCAVLMARLHEFDAHGHAVATGPAIEQPMAFAVTPVQTDVFHLHAWRMARTGLLRVTFLTLPDAVLWAGRRRAVAASLVQAALRSARP